jgi:hypothetical protein
MIRWASRVRLQTRLLLVIAAAAMLLTSGALPASASSSHKTHRVHIGYHGLGKVTHYKNPPHVDGAGQVAFIGTKPQHCEQDTWYEVTSSEPVFMVDNQGDVFESGPGGQIKWTLDETSTTTISASASGSASTDIPIDILIVAVKLTVSARIVQKVSETIDTTYKHNIPNNDLGFIGFGSWGYRVSWAEYAERGVCSYPEIAHGTGLAPTKHTGWHYWQQKY